MKLYKYTYRVIISHYCLNDFREAGYLYANSIGDAISKLIKLDNQAYDIKMDYICNVIEGKFENGNIYIMKESK